MKTNTSHLVILLALSLGAISVLMWILAGKEPVVTRAQGVDSYGVYYVALGGDCGGVEPCYGDIQDAVDAADDPDDVIKVAGGTYTKVSVRPRNDITTTAVVTQVAYISKTVTMRGGYTTADWATFDPETNPVVLNAQGQGRVLYITGYISPTVEGLCITGGDATGMGGNSYLDKDAGGGVYIITATAVISGNRIFGNVAQRGAGLYLHASDAEICGNMVFSNSTDREPDDNGGGLYLWYSDARLTENTVSSNIAYSGGGAYLRSSNPHLNNNKVVANVAEWKGGGLTAAWYDASLIEGNIISFNRANDQGGGLYLFSSDAEVSDNIITSNMAFQGGGLCLWASAATLHKNVISSNAAEHGGGLCLEHSDVDLINSLVVENRSDDLGSGLYIAGSSPRLRHATIARNSGGDGSGIYVDTYVTDSEATLYSSVSLTNTILVSHTVGISVTGGNTVTVDSVLWYDMPITVSRSVTATLAMQNQYEGNPAFVDPNNGDYHLSSGSAAIAKGVDAGVYEDMDGNPRPPEGCDLGADELPIVYLPIVGKLFPPILPIGHVDMQLLTHGITVVDGHAYVALCEHVGQNPYSVKGGLQIVDVSNPILPTKRGSYISSYCAWETAVAGNYAYIADVASRGGALRIMDISEPANPHLANSWVSPDYPIGFSNVSISGKYAYVAPGHWSAGLMVLNISNPTNPTVVGRHSFQGFVEKILVSDGRMYLLTSEGLHILDSTTMSEIGFYAAAERPSSVAVQGKYAYVASRYGSLHVVDISNPVNPTEIGSYVSEGGYLKRGVVVVGKYVYFPGGSNGVYVLDVSAPGNPVEVAVYDTYGSASDITTDGALVYVIDSGVSVFKLFGSATSGLDTQ
jgi:hypothetical protein